MLVTIVNKTMVSVQMMATLRTQVDFQAVMSATMTSGNT